MKRRCLYLKLNNDLFISDDTTKQGGLTEEVGFEASCKFEKQGKFLDTIFCSNDTQVVGAIYAASKLGLKVPDDIAIMGYDKIKLSKYLELTTID